MARAKRTDRTEARRRYRAEQATLAAEAEEPEEATPSDDRHAGADKAEHAGTEGGRPGRSKQARTTAGSTYVRPSIMGAFRGAVRPLDWRADVRELPRLVRHWSFWAPALVSVASTVLFFLVVPAGTSTVSGGLGTSGSLLTTVAYISFQMFVLPIPAPVAAAFIAGLGAPRASWLIGALVGLVAALGFAAIVLSPAYAEAATANQTSSTALALQGIAFAPFGSALFASLAAWYRRFLNLANPNRSQRPTRPTRGRGDLPTNSRATASRRS